VVLRARRVYYGFIVAKDHRRRYNKFGAFMSQRQFIQTAFSQGFGLIHRLWMDGMDNLMKVFAWPRWKLGPRGAQGGSTDPLDGLGLDEPSLAPHGPIFGGLVDK